MSEIGKKFNWDYKKLNKKLKTLRTRKLTLRMSPQKRQNWNQEEYIWSIWFCEYKPK